MRKELYLAICEALKGLEEVEIKHIDLWNQNVEFIEQEVWNKPAVFVEFEPINWSPLVGGLTISGRGRLRLHIVTDWVGSSEDGSNSLELSLEHLKYSEYIMQAMLNIRGTQFYGIQLVETHTNHNHEEIVESIEVYDFKCVREL